MKQFWASRSAIGSFARTVGCALLWLALTAGCGRECRNTGAQPYDVRRLNALQSELDRLYRDYLTNDISSARRAMTQAVSLIESFKPASVVEETLWLGYARLHLLEAAAGNQDLARLYYEKARYWLMTNMERRGIAAAEIVRKMADFTPEQCREAALSWDRVFTEGRGPRFVQNQ